MNGMWSEAFERLHHAATHGAPTDEIERLAAAELAELLDAEEDGSSSTTGVGRF